MSNQSQSREIEIIDAYSKYAYELMSMIKIMLPSCKFTPEIKDQMTRILEMAMDLKALIKENHFEALIVSARARGINIGDTDKKH